MSPSSVDLHVGRLKLFSLPLTEFDLARVPPHSPKIYTFTFEPVQSRRQARTCLTNSILELIQNSNLAQFKFPRAPSPREGPARSTSSLEVGLQWTTVRLRPVWTFFNYPSALHWDFRAFLCFLLTTCALLSKLERLVGSDWWIYNVALILSPPISGGLVRVECGWT